MPDPTDSPTVSVPTSGRVEVPGTPAGTAIEWHRRGDSAEAAIGQLSAGGAGSDPTVAAAIGDELRALHEELRASGIELHLAADHPADALEPLPEGVADSAGLDRRRDLLQLRRPLPVEADHPARAIQPAIALALRPFDPGTDDEAWITVNNRAFAAHPDQGRETAETLAARMSEPWFDADGFLLADEPGRPGELAGFCWTKVHEPGPDGGDRLGEIYVIGVDPRHRGERLGPPLVLAGLDHMAGRGITTAVLYVDADNAPARRLYDELGFEVHVRRRVYSSSEPPT